MLPRMILSPSTPDRWSADAVAAESFPAPPEFDTLGLAWSSAVRVNTNPTRAPSTTPATKIPIARCTDRRLSTLRSPGHFFRRAPTSAPAPERLHPGPGKREPGKAD